MGANGSRGSMSKFSFENRVGMRVNSLNCPSSARPNGGCICHSTLFGHEIFMIFQPDYAYRPLFYCSHNSIPCCEVNYITGFMHTNPDVQYSMCGVRPHTHLGACPDGIVSAPDYTSTIATPGTPTVVGTARRRRFREYLRGTSSVADTSSAPACCSSTHNERVCPRLHVRRARTGSSFRWGEGNDVTWLVDNHAGHMVGWERTWPAHGRLPSYSGAKLR